MGSLRSFGWDKIEDTEAVEAVLAGEYSTFEVLVRRYNERLFRVGMGYLHSHSDVEDAMQETYLKAFQKMHQFSGKSAFGTWITRIMINECLMKIRRSKKEPLPRDQEDDGQEGYRAERRSYKFREVETGEVNSVFEESLSRLPRDYRVIYMLREVQGLSTNETAKCLEISPENVKVRLHRAQSLLKTLLLEVVNEKDLFAFPAVYCDPLTAKVMSRIDRLVGKKEQ